MIQYLLFDTSKLLNISDITKRIGSFFMVFLIPNSRYKSIGGDDITLQCYSSEQITEMEIHRFTDEELNTSEVTDNGLN